MYGLQVDRTHSTGILLCFVFVCFLGKIRPPLPLPVWEILDPPMGGRATLGECPFPTNLFFFFYKFEKMQCAIFQIPVCFRTTNNRIKIL